MGYEVPVEMPSMGVYNTDLMKMYIAGVKDQYEKGQEEMKDFMKLYGDFYSDVPGATQAYNDLTLGGARDMINQMYAAGIDPYKSPEARAAISRYIASRPTGLLNQMKKSAENAAIYKKALAEAQNDPNFDPEYNKYMLGGDLESWNPRKPWTALAPYMAPSAESTFKPYMEKFKQSEILPKDEQDRPGYIKVGTTKENKQGALRAALENYEKTPYGQYKRQQANQIAAEATNPDGTPLTPEQRQALAQSIFEQPAKDYARQFFQPAYEDDWRAKADYQARVSAKYSGAGNQNKPGTSWVAKWLATTSNRIQGNSKTILDGQKNILASVPKTKESKSGGKMSEIGASVSKIVKRSVGSKVVDRFGTKMTPTIIAAVLGGNKLDADGTIQLSLNDVSKLKSYDQIYNDMAYSTTISNPKKVDVGVIADIAKEKRGFCNFDSDELIMYVDNNGRVKFAASGYIQYGTAEKGKEISGEKYILPTNLGGTLDTSGSFIPDDYTAAYLDIIDQVGTLTYATKGNKTKDTSDE